MRTGLANADVVEPRPVPSVAPRPSFRDLMAAGHFVHGAELVSTRGYAPVEAPGKLAELGEALCESRRADWLSLTDSPGGHTMLPPDWLGRIFKGAGKPLVLHLACKDLNRSGLESAAWNYASEGFENVVAMTGDFPSGGFGGRANPVFDLDSVGLISMLDAMNRGIEVSGRGGVTRILPRTNFFIGCVVSPFKRLESELMPQYFKLLRKISCGARYVYTQLGYDMRKFHEVKLLLAAHGLDIPVIGNVFLLNRTAAGMFHQNRVPGCVVSDRLMELVERYSGGADKGRAFFKELAAKQLAVFRGLGFAGGYLGGMSKAETFLEVIEMADGFGRGDWREFAREIQYPLQGEFYLFERDAGTGLGHPGDFNRKYLASLEHPAPSRHVTLTYRLSRFIHDKVFTPGTPVHGLMKRLYERWERRPALLSRGMNALERLSKTMAFGCRGCGDCSLPDCAYLCPLASCSKSTRNGPCGGSRDGMCETHDKECIWSRAYERLKFYQESERMLQGPAVIPRNELRGTSSWANAFLGRDHHSRRPPEE